MGGGVGYPGCWIMSDVSNHIENVEFDWDQSVITFKSINGAGLKYSFTGSRKEGEKWINHSGISTVTLEDRKNMPGEIHTSSDGDIKFEFLENEVIVTLGMFEGQEVREVAEKKPDILAAAIYYFKNKENPYSEKALLKQNAGKIYRKVEELAGESDVEQSLPGTILNMQFVMSS